MQSFAHSLNIYHIINIQNPLLNANAYRVLEVRAVVNLTLYNDVFKLWLCELL